MTRSTRVAAVQLRAHDRVDFSHVLPGVLAAAADAANGAELVVLPEGTFPAYVLGSERIDAAEIDAALGRLRELAEKTRTTFVVGAAAGNGARARNAAVVIDRDGTVAGSADKLFLWHFDRRWFDAGERIEPVDTALGRLGVLICADGRIPTIARTLVDRGAEILVMPTAWVTSGRNPQVLENVQADLLARVRAFENGVPFVAANKCGTELGMVAYCGKSQVVDARGDVAALGAEREPAIVKAVIDIGKPRPYRASLATPNPRAAANGTGVRIALSYDALPADTSARLDILDDAYAIAPGDAERFAALDRAIPSVFVDDDTVFDPAGLVAYRRAGYQIAIWNARRDSGQTERIARARALELRVYVVVLDEPSRRAYAVDPDGIVIAGTFDGFRIASFAFDPRRTLETTVAPGTNVSDGLERVAALNHREETVRH